MAVGEAQILGQMRDALARGPARRAGGGVAQLALPAGPAGRQAGPRRDRHRPAQRLARAHRPRGGRRASSATSRGRSAAVVGAGGMSGLAAATARRDGIGVAHHRQPHAGAGRAARRTRGRRRPAVGRARRRRWPRATSSSPAPAPSGTSSPGETARPQRAAARGRRPQVVIDLALPRDVEPADDLDRSRCPVSRSSTSRQLGRLPRGTGRPHRGRAASATLVTAEVADYLTRRMEKSVAPTVAALRARAASLVAAEMDRLDQRLPRPRRGDACRGRPRRAPHRREAAPHADPPGQGVRDGGQRRRLRRSPARALRPRAASDVANVSSPPKRVTP